MQFNNLLKTKELTDTLDKSIENQKELIECTKKVLTHLETTLANLEQVKQLGFKK